MRLTSALASAGAAALLLVAAASGGDQAGSVQLRADLKPVKGVASSGSGVFTATVTGTSLKWKLTFRGLTSAASESHVHAGTLGPERVGPTVAVLCASFLEWGTPCKSGTTGTTKLDRGWIALVKSGKTYVNIHTEKHVNGEVQGRLTVRR